MGCFSLLKYQKTQHDEKQYLHLIKKLLDHQYYRCDRTLVGTYSDFGATMTFDLHNNTFPLLTTKKVFFNIIAEELFWFLSGSTDVSKLKEKGITIWDQHSNRKFLDLLGFSNRIEGDIGPGYGFQWRHAGAQYIDCKTDYTNQGVDQISHIINTLKTNPSDRRMILSGWNPSDLHLMNLPPCHCLAQFYVYKDELFCQLYQRSCDMGLGVPFNIASYSLLTIILASITNLKPGKFIHVLGDYHVYINHIDLLKQQMKLKPKPFPKLYLTHKILNIDNLNLSDFNLVDYKHHPHIKLPMAI